MVNGTPQYNRKALRKTILIAICLVAASVLFILGLNYCVDADGVFHHEVPRAERIYADAFAQSAIRSRSGTVASGHERVVKQAFLEQATADCWTVGSSRIMNISSEQITNAFKCKHAINLGVSGAGFEDIVAELYLISKKSSARMVFIGIDPWTFARHSDTRYEEFGSAVPEAMNYYGLPFRDYGSYLTLSQKYKTLINIKYALKNYAALQRVRETPPAFVEVGLNGANVEDAVTRPDGSHVYSKAYQTIMPTRWDGNHSAYKLIDAGIDNQVIQAYATIFKKLQATGTTPVMILMPYHPRVFDCEKPIVCQKLKAAEIAARKLSNDEKVELIGSYNPETYKLTANDFLSDMFIWPNKILSVLKN
jgi:hypothetical protein